MSAAKRITALAVAALLAIAAYWYWSPYLAIRSMKNAAQERDAAAFNAYVNYSSLRQNLKRQLASRPLPKVSGDGADIGTAIASLGLGRVIIDAIVDAMITPEMVMKGMREIKFQMHSGKRASDAPASQAAADWRLVRIGANRVLVERGAEASASGGFVFERSGFASWDLTDVRLPAIPRP